MILKYYTYSLAAYAIVTSSLFASLSIDQLEDEMTAAERKSTGISKLTKSERTYLEKWIEQNQSDYHFTVPTVSNVRDIRWLYESIRLHTPSTTKTYDEQAIVGSVAICAVFQNNASQLKEWIDYHKKLGVDHFYLYNQLSNDDYLNVLQHYIEIGEVTLIHWAKLSDPCKVKAEVYQNALAQSQGRSKWLLLLSIDEYLVIDDQAKLTSVLQTHKDCTKLYIASSSEHFLIKPHMLHSPAFGSSQELSISKR